MDKVTVEIKGLEELEKKMFDLPDKFVRKGVRESLKAGGEVLKEEMETTAPKRTGELAGHIDATVSMSAKNEAGTVSVGPDKQHFYGLFDEFGTSKMAARPFVRPAFENRGQDAMDTLVAKLREVFGEVFK